AQASSNKGPEPVFLPALSQSPDLTETATSTVTATLTTVVTGTATLAPTFTVTMTPSPGTPEPTGTPHQVTICHRTGSSRNPYVMITVSADALPAHTAHGDIIPAPAGGCPATAPGGGTHPGNGNSNNKGQQASPGQQKGKGESSGESDNANGSQGHNKKP